MIVADLIITKVSAFLYVKVPILESKNIAFIRGPMQNPYGKFELQSCMNTQESAGNLQGGCMRMRRMRII